MKLIKVKESLYLFEADVLAVTYYYEGAREIMRFPKIIFRKF